MIEGSRTELELINAFAGESQARNRYTYYASIAKKEGYEQISNIFIETANNEKEHAKVFFKLIPEGIKPVNASYPFSLGDTKANLKSAIEGETAEWEVIYQKSANIARSEGYKEIAETFLRVIDVEKHHSHRYAELLENLINEEVFTREKEEQWICTNCGYITIAKCAPIKCPLCKHPQGYYEIFNEKF